MTISKFATLHDIVHKRILLRSSQLLKERQRSLTSDIILTSMTGPAVNHEQISMLCNTILLENTSLLS